MKNPHYFIYIFCILFTAVVNAGEVTSSFNDGDILTQTSLNDLKDNINDNNSRLNAVENTILDNASNDNDYTGYDIQFSEIGSPKNVVIMRRNDTLGTVYQARISYKNSSDQFSVNGSLIAPALVVQYVDILIDKTDGALLYLSVDTDMPKSELYLNFDTETATYDVSNLNKTVTNNTYSTQKNCSHTGAISYCKQTLLNNKIVSSNESYLLNHRLLGPGTIDGISFDKLRATNRFNNEGNNPYFEIRAKGIGRVFKGYYGATPSLEVVYYRVDNKEEGSLTGTPFDYGQVLEGLFF